MGLYESVLVSFSCCDGSAAHKCTHKNRNKLSISEKSEKPTFETHQYPGSNWINWLLHVMKYVLVRVVFFHKNVWRLLHGGHNGLFQKEGPSGDALFPLVVQATRQY